MHHAERLAAIEKGIELPPLPPEAFHDPYYGVGYRGEYRRWSCGHGVTLILVGAAVTAALWTQGGTDFWWGLVIVAWGLGRLVSGHFFEGPSRVRQAGVTAPAPGGMADRRARDSDDRIHGAAGSWPWRKRDSPRRTRPFPGLSRAGSVVCHG